MVTDVMTDIRRWGTKYPIIKYRVEKVKNEKKANNDKKYLDNKINDIHMCMTYKN